MNLLCQDLEYAQVQRVAMTQDLEYVLALVTHVVQMTQDLECSLVQGVVMTLVLDRVLVLVTHIV
jgi:hypothetical protein